MKLFVAETLEKGYYDVDNYHWCDDDDLLMFGMFQTDDNRKENEYSMCGINSRKFTTHILVKDVKIDHEFFVELVSDSVAKAMNTTIDENGNFGVNFGDDWNMIFNINDIVDELISKVNLFECGDKLKCVGKVLTKIN